jgi:hypothetical protein
MKAHIVAFATLLLILTAGLFVRNVEMAFSSEISPRRELKDGYLNEKLLNLVSNRWVKIHSSKNEKFNRQVHAGIAYDSKRGRILIFGSDTHNTNWDNSVHEFDPYAETWTTHYQNAPKETYRADDLGRAVCGSDRLLPWAMHSFDNIVYDPKLDAVIVTAFPGHNPIKKKIPAAKVHPTWIYDLKSRTWRTFENEGKPSPTFFAAASAYDSHRDVIVGYKSGGVWELGPERSAWMKATGESHHVIHFNMDYDSKHKCLLVFGDFKNSNVVWIYRPGPEPGDKGTWGKRVPGGDPCPPDQHFPVAFDEQNGVFLLVPDNNEPALKQKGRKRFLPARSAGTFVYDPETNRYTRIREADLPPQKMNYMMVYDRFHKVFLLVTGDWKRPLTVWALKLDVSKLK